MSAADLSQSRLYGIVDLSYLLAADVSRIATQMIGGGVDIIQLRGKDVELRELAPIAIELKKITRDAGVPLVINDHPELARETGADGVHVGQDDLAVAEARAIAGEHCVVGKSTHTLEQAKRAAAEGADYIGFGPLFATPTKPDYVPIGLDDVAAVQQIVQLPVFCIGGIKLDNLRAVIAAGARRVVIVSGLLRAPDVAEYARAAKRLLENANTEKSSLTQA